MRWTRAAAAIGLLLVTLPAAAGAQEHAVSQADLDALVMAHAETLDTDRTALREWLARPDVARVAATVGIDIRQADAAAATLDAEDARQLTAHLAGLDASQAGAGDAITIQTTTLIIVLLILIIIL